MLAETVGDRRYVLGGHSMGAHTALAHALERPERVAGLVIVCPAYTGPASEDVLDYWDGLAEGLESGGEEGFVERIEAAGIDPAWRETVLRITRERISLHRHPEALVGALREVPRSRPFETISDLETLEVPALVVASHDVADPGHPFAVAEAYAERLPEARLISEAAGESPLAWQGGRLSREIASFCAEARSRSGWAPTNLRGMIDDGEAIHYAAVERGTSVFSSDGVEVGKVEQVLDNYREHIFDGVVFRDSGGELRFADAPEVARTATRGVTLTIDAVQAAALPPPERGPGDVSAEHRRRAASRGCSAAAGRGSRPQPGRPGGAAGAIGSTEPRSGQERTASAAIRMPAAVPIPRSPAALNAGSPRLSASRTM